MAIFDTGIFDTNIFDTIESDVVVVAPATDPEINPHIMLSWSDDGGKTWHGYREYPIGEQGKYRVRVKANRLGQSSRKGRAYRVEFSAARPFRLIGALANVDVLKP